jgi:hypothetical protein
MPPGANRNTGTRLLPRMGVGSIITGSGPAPGVGG